MHSHPFQKPSLHPNVLFLEQNLLFFEKSAPLSRIKKTPVPIPLIPLLNPPFETTKTKDREAPLEEEEDKYERKMRGYNTGETFVVLAQICPRKEKSVATETQEHNVPLQEERWRTLKVFKHSTPSENDLKTPHISGMKKTNNAFTIFHSH